MHNEYRLTPDKIKIKREMMPEYQLKIADLYNISIGKKTLHNFFDKNRMRCIMKLTTLFKTRIKTKINTSYIRI